MKTYRIADIENKYIFGRTTPLEKGKPLVLFWAASGLELNVKSSNVYLLLSSDYDTSEPWISVYIKHENKTNNNAIF